MSPLLHADEPHYVILKIYWYMVSYTSVDLSIAVRYVNNFAKHTSRSCLGFFFLAANVVVCTLRIFRFEKQTRIKLQGTWEHRQTIDSLF